MNLIRWGILGCGNVTEVKSGPGFSKAAGSQLVAVMRRDAAMAQDYARRHSVARWYADAAALIADREVDAVYIATPPGSHEEHAMAVLAAGKPCYVEKPMSRNAAESRRMVEAFRAKGVPLYVAYYRRALPRFLKAKELIDSGALGRITAVSYRYADSNMAKPQNPPPWRVVAEHSGGGLFLDIGSHALDMLDFWFGPLTVVKSQARNTRKADRVEDQVQASLTARAIPVTFETDFNARSHDEFVITGDAGELRLSCFGNDPVRLKTSARGTESFDLPNPPHVAQPLIQTVVDDLLGKSKCASTGESGLRTQEVMDQMLTEYYGGREDGFWKRPWPGSP
jgi:predicted dehydrogenase